MSADNTLADADLLRRLDDEAERARIAGFQHLEELLREARARIAQMAQELQRGFRTTNVEAEARAAICSSVN